MAQCLADPGHSLARMALRKNCQAFEIGVKFNDEKTTFRMRMIEQICYIEEYRKNLCRVQKREIPWQEASDDWISKFAADFPGNGN